MLGSIENSSNRVSQPGRMFWKKEQFFSDEMWGGTGKSWVVNLFIPVPFAHGPIVTALPDHRPATPPPTLFPAGAPLGRTSDRGAVFIKYHRLSITSGWKPMFLLCPILNINY